MEETISLRDIFKILKKRVVLIFLTTIIGVLAAGFVTFFIITPKYSSEAQLIVTLTQSDTASVNANDVNANLLMLNTYKDLIKGNAVLTAVKERAASEKNFKGSVEELNGMISVSQSENSQMFSNAVNSLAESYDVPVIYSTHPRSKKFIEQREFIFHPNVRSLQPFDFSDYNYLQQNALCVVSDSGTVAEEASFFKFPAVSIRTSTERPEALDKGNMIIGSITTEQVLQAVEMAIEMNSSSDLGIDVPDYVDGNVSTKVIKIIQSYTGIVNKMVWRKY